MQPPSTATIYSPGKLVENPKPYYWAYALVIIASLAASIKFGEVSYPLTVPVITLAACACFITWAVNVRSELVALAFEPSGQMWVKSSRNWTGPIDPQSVKAMAIIGRAPVLLLFQAEYGQPSMYSDRLALPKKYRNTAEARELRVVSVGLSGFQLIAGRWGKFYYIKPLSDFVAASPALKSKSVEARIDHR